jgi:transposase-like protein
LLPVLRGHILRASDVYTDGWKAYDGLVNKGCKHHRVFHHANEFARGKNHVNGIESFWSFAKFRLNKRRGIRQQKFFMHLKECEWRWHHSGENLTRLLLKSCRLKPLNTTLS